MLWTPQTFHATSIPCGTKVWQVEKYWDERTMQLFLKARHTVLWPFSKPAPFRRNKSEQQVFRRVAWVLKEKNLQEGDKEKEDIRIWAEVHAFIKSFTQVQVFLGFIEADSNQCSEHELEQALSSLLTGIFISTRCDHLKITPIGLPLEKALRQITGGRLVSNQAICFVPDSYWAKHDQAAISTPVMVAGLTKGEWFKVSYAQESLNEQKYLRDKMKSLVEKERAVVFGKMKKPRRSLLGRLFKPTI